MGMFSRQARGRGWLAGLRRSAAGWRWLARIRARRRQVCCAFGEQNRVRKLQVMRKANGAKKMMASESFRRAERAVFLTCGHGRHAASQPGITVGAPRKRNRTGARGECHG